MADPKRSSKPLKSPAPSGRDASSSRSGVPSRKELFAAVLAYYRTLESTRAGQREASTIERGNEEYSQLKPWDRLSAIAMGRDLERNNSKAITILEQLKVMVAGEVKAQFNTEDREWNRQAGELFNAGFAQDCWYNAPASLSEVVQLVEAARVREGDILVAFDDFLLNSGQLMLWEADQLCCVRDADWKDPEINTLYRYERTDPETGAVESLPFLQDSGVVVNQYNRTVAYIVTSIHQAAEETDRALLTLPYSEVLIIPAEQARLVMRRFRPGQRRGVPSILPVADNLADIDSMVKSELATSRVRAMQMAVVKHNAETAEAEAEANLLEMLERTVDRPAGEGEASEGDAAAADASAGNDASENPREVKVLKAYRKLEEATGGMTEYAETGDEILFPSPDRPNLDTNSFYDHLGDLAGAAHGLSRGYTRMTVEASYTAHRGETAMTWRHIANRQKAHEHAWLDWLAVKVLERAITAGELPDGPPGWRRRISWGFPLPDAIDPEKEARADLLDLKNGKRTFRDIAGPNWLDNFEELAGELKQARSLSIPLAINETVAGALVPDEQATEKETGS